MRITFAREVDSMADAPPHGLPRYRVLTGPDDDTFCHRVSEALDIGFRLYGNPAITPGPPV
jgi:hypothetical protein